MLPMAVFLHCLFGGWMMTSPTLSNPTPLSSFVTSLGSGVSSGYSSALSLLGNAQVGTVAFVTRALNWNAVAQLLIAVLMILYYLLGYLSDMFLFCDFKCSASLGGACAGCVTCCRSSKVRPADVHADCTYREAERQFSMRTYRVSEQREFRDAYLRAVSDMQNKPLSEMSQNNAWMIDTDLPIDQQPQYQV